MQMSSIDLTDLIIQKREEIIAIAAQYGASSVRVIGSVARGDYGEHSDIDLLVDIDDQLKLCDLSEDLAEMLGVRVDVLSLENVRSEKVRNYMLKECIQL